jgi:hypothetical protein
MVSAFGPARDNDVMLAVRHLAAAGLPAVRPAGDGLPDYVTAAFFVDAPATLLFQASASAAIAARHSRGLRVVLICLGWPL